MEVKKFAGRTAKVIAKHLQMIKEIQGKLAGVGYYAGPLDGKSGPGLKDAMKQIELLGPPRGI